MANLIQLLVNAPELRRMINVVCALFPIILGDVGRMDSSGNPLCAPNNRTRICKSSFRCTMSIFHMQYWTMKTYLTYMLKFKICLTSCVNFLQIEEVANILYNTVHVGDTFSVTLTKRRAIKVLIKT